MKVDTYVSDWIRERKLNLVEHAQANSESEFIS